MRLRLLPLLIVAAVVMLGVRVGDLWQGLAQAATAEEKKTAAAAPASETPGAVASASAGSTAAPGPAGVPPVDPFSLTDSEIELLQKLAARREELEKRGLELEQREVLLTAAESRIEERIQELKALQANIEGMIEQRDEKQEAQLRSLVKIYESMKPKEAARIFEELDMAVLLEVIDRMKERKSAPILAKMNPDKAKEVTVELADRHKLPLRRN